MQTVHHLATRRPALPFDRDAISARNRHAFAAGDQCRRLDLATHLRAMADAVANGEANELVEQAATRAVGLFRRGVR